MKKSTQTKKPFADIKLWKNGFDYGLKCGKDIVCYSITEHIPVCDEKKKFAEEFIKQLKGE